MLCSANQTEWGLLFKYYKDITDFCKYLQNNLHIWIVMEKNPVLVFVYSRNTVVYEGNNFSILLDMIIVNV